jgi:hypothetical protein
MIKISEIKTGDCLLVSSYSFIAKAIQLFQKNKYNHAAIFVWIEGKLFVSEADKYGICLTPEDLFNSDLFEHIEIR